MIRQLYIKDIGPFKELEISFEKCPDENKAEIHIFTGPNGVGKTTILYVLAGAFANSDGNALRKRFKNDEYPFFVIEGFEHPFCEIGLDNNYVKILQDKLAFTDYLKDHLLRRDLKHVYNKDGLGWYHENPGVRYIAFAYSGYRKLDSSQINSINEIRDFPFPDKGNLLSTKGNLLYEPANDSPLYNALSFDLSINSSLFINWIALLLTKRDIEKGRGNKPKVDRLVNAVKSIENAVRKITELNIEFILETEPFGVKLKIGDNLLEFDILPDGVKSILSWIGDLLMRMERMRWEEGEDIFKREFILFLDEIDIHLHPLWQRRILPAVQELFPNAQIFVSTHSPFVVGSVKDAFVYSFNLENNVSKLLKKESSKAGYSYPYVLEDIFSIEDLFDIGTHEELLEFYSLRNKLLQQLKDGLLDGDEYDRFIQYAKTLSEVSLEINDIVVREVRQFSRITGKKVEL